MDKVNIIFYTKLPFISITEKGSKSLDKRARSPSGSLELLKLPAKSKESSKVIFPPASTTFNCSPLPSNFPLDQNEEKLINMDSVTIFNEPLDSPADSLNSFGSSGARIIKKKIIPNLSFSLSLSDSSMSSSSLPTDEESRLLKDKDDSLRDFLVLIHDGTEEDPQ